MKVTTAHFDALKQAIEPLDTAERRQRYLAYDFPNSGNVKDLDVRYRWDLLWQVVDARALSFDFYGADYQNAHIETALRRIVPDVDVCPVCAEAGYGDSPENCPVCEDEREQRRELVAPLTKPWAGHLP